VPTGSGQTVALRAASLCWDALVAVDIHNCPPVLPNGRHGGRGLLWPTPVGAWRSGMPATVGATVMGVVGGLLLLTYNI